MSQTYNPLRVGVYVDTSNMYLNGGQRMRYDVLREFATRDRAELVRLNAYVTFDNDRAKTDPLYEKGVKRFHAVLRDFGYKVIVKEVRWFEDESGKRFGKANAEMMKQLGVAGPPTMIFFKDSREIPGTRLVGDVNIESLTWSASQLGGQ